MKVNIIPFMDGKNNNKKGNLKKDKHLNKEDFEKIQDAIKKVDKEFEENKNKEVITNKNEIIVSNKDKEENKEFLTNEDNKKQLKIYIIVHEIWQVCSEILIMKRKLEEIGIFIHW